MLTYFFKSSLNDYLGWRSTPYTEGRNNFWVLWYITHNHIINIYVSGGWTCNQWVLWTRRSGEIRTQTHSFSKFVFYYDAFTLWNDIFENNSKSQLESGKDWKLDLRKQFWNFKTLVKFNANHSYPQVSDEEWWALNKHFLSSRGGPGSREEGCAEWHLSNSKPSAGILYMVSSNFRIEIQTKIKGKLSSLEQLEWTAAVNNGCSGFYFPISDFPKSQTQIISSLCFFYLFTKWGFTWGTRFCWLKCHFYWNHPFNYYLKMLTVGSGWCCFYSNKTKDIHVPITTHKKGVASLLLTKG